MCPICLVIVSDKSSSMSTAATQRNCHEKKTRVIYSYISARIHVSKARWLMIHECNGHLRRRQRAPHNIMQGPTTRHQNSHAWNKLIFRNSLPEINLNFIVAGQFLQNTIQRPVIQKFKKRKKFSHQNLHTHFQL